MMKRTYCSCAILLLWLFTNRAEAHPHVWVTFHSEVLYAADGAVTGVRHAWTFDDMFSAYALQGISHTRKGQYTREELASLAQTNVDSLTLHFTLPLKAAASAKTMQIEIYDPSIFVDFEFAKDKPVSLNGAPQCLLTYDLPHQPTPAEQMRLSQLDATPLDANSPFAEIFANKMLVRCP